MTPSRPDVVDAGSTDSPLQLRVLGAIELRGADTHVDAVLAQPRRFALLVYLLLRRAGSFLRRDELLGVFWAESSESRARAALRQAIHFLRSELGQGVVVGRGDAELGVAPGAITCDALQFMRKLDAGNDRRALDRYGGELLPGFLVSDAPVFERWLVGERHRLAREAAEAALRLADRAEEEGDLDEAVLHTRRSLDLDPMREAVARRLISLYDRLGDRASAAVTYERLTRRLREKLDVEPAPETTELIEAVRARSGVEATVERGEEPSNGELEARRVLVAPLENLTGDETLEAMGRMVADWIAGRLAAISELAVLSPGLSPSGGVYRTHAGVASVRERAEDANAGTVISGAYYTEGNQLRVEVQIIDVDQGTLIPGPEPVLVSKDAPLEGMSDLQDRLLTCVAPELSRRSIHVQVGTRPPSYEAYQAYMDGLEVFIRGGWREALASFHRAIDLEPEYPLPRVVSAIAHWNLSELPEARSIAREADARRSSLGPFERAVLDMVLAWLEGDWAAAHEAVLVQAELAPGSLPHYQVAEEARRLNRPRESLNVLSDLDPEAGELRGFLFYWIELTTSHHFLGNHSEELEAARYARRLHPDHPGATLLEARALAALGRTDRLEGVLEESLASSGARRPLPGELLRESALELRAHGRMAAAASVLEKAVNWFSDRIEEGTSSSLRREYARTLYAADRLEPAQRLFRELSDEGPGGVVPVGFHHGHLRAHMDEGYLAVIAERRGRTAEAERLAEHLRTWDHPFSFGAPWFWLAALAAARDEKRQAVSHLRRAFSDGLPHQMLLHTDPHLALLRGDPVFEALMRPRG